MTGPQLRLPSAYTNFSDPSSQHPGVEPNIKSESFNMPIHGDEARDMQFDASMFGGTSCSEDQQFGHYPAYNNSIFLMKGNEYLHHDYFNESSDLLPVGIAAFANDHGVSSTNIDAFNAYRTSNEWSDKTLMSNTGPSFTNQYPTPFSTQSTIIGNRDSTVREDFGQITPPEEKMSRSLTVGKSSKHKSLIDPVKSQRARYAANTRHAQSKKKHEAAAAARELSVVPEDASSPEDKREKYREKNRVAAAKCRAKKKTNTDGLEDRCRELQLINNVHKHEVQMLRQELSRARTAALPHSAGLCPCVEVHHYNKKRLEEMTSEARTAVCVHRRLPSVSSLSDTSMTSFDSTPSTDEQMRKSMSDQLSAGSGTQDTWPGYQGYPAPSELAFVLSSTPDPMQSLMATTTDNVQSFGTYMTSSPDGQQSATQRKPAKGRKRMVKGVLV